MSYRYGVDYSYIIYVLPALIFALWAQFNVKSTFAKYASVPSDRGMTGADAARLILDSNGLTNTQIEQVTGELTDHYDPKANVIRLSQSTYGVSSAVAVGVAAHEAGHAIQYAQNYAPIRLRAAIIPVTNISSKAAFPLVILGVLFSWSPLAYLGVILFAAAVLFQLVTLPVEINASRRAVAALSNSGMSEDGLKAAKKVLTAAALTYVAAIASAIGSFLRLLTIARRSDRR